MFETVSPILSIIAVVELTAQTNGLVRYFPAYTWHFLGIAALLDLALSLPLGRVATALAAGQFAREGEAVGPCPAA